MLPPRPTAADDRPSGGRTLRSPVDCPAMEKTEAERWVSYIRHIARNEPYLPIYYVVRILELTRQQEVEPENSTVDILSRIRRQQEAADSHQPEDSGSQPT